MDQFLLFLNQHGLFRPIQPLQRTFKLSQHKCEEVLRRPFLRSLIGFPIPSLRSRPQTESERPCRRQQDQESAHRLCKGRCRPKHGRSIARELPLSTSLNSVSLPTLSASSLTFFALQDIKQRYPLVLDVGSGPGFLAKHMDSEITKKVVMVDSSSQSCPVALRYRIRRADAGSFIGGQRACCFVTKIRNSMVRSAHCSPARAVAEPSWFAPTVPVERIHLDEEELASRFEENSHDAIMSCLSLHWINDLPGQSITSLLECETQSL